MRAQDGPVIEAAKEWFCAPQPERFRYIEADANNFVRETDRKYDLVILDAYDGDSIPAPLATRSFLENVCDRLKPHGVLAVNFFEFDSRTNRTEWFGAFKALCDSVYHSIAPCLILHKREAFH
eukprot:scaffold1006_cov408-Prasinococcus_capsulatus_cf.AAC.25